MPNAQCTLDPVQVANNRPQCKHDWCDNMAERKRNGDYYDVCNTCRRSAPLVRRAVMMATAQSRAALTEAEQVIRTLQDQLKGRGGELLTQSEESKRVYLEQREKLNAVNRECVDLRKRNKDLENRHLSNMQQLEAYRVLKQDYAHRGQTLQKVTADRARLRRELDQAKVDPALDATKKKYYESEIERLGDALNRTNKLAASRAGEILTLENKVLKRDQALSTKNDEIDSLTDDLQAMRETEESNVTEYARKINLAEAQVSSWQGFFWGAAGLNVMSLSVIAYLTFIA